MRLVSWHNAVRLLLLFVLEWTKLVWTPALGLYIGMDKTSLDTSSWTLFVREGGMEGGREGVERRVT